MAAFLDTNVLVYAVDASDERKRAVALEILEDVSLEPVVSAQVLEEFFWVATRKLRPPMAEEAAEAMVADLARAAMVVPVDGELVLDAIALARSEHLALWDAAVATAASRAGCTELLTEDLNDGQVLDGVRVRNPFAHA